MYEIEKRRKKTGWGSCDEALLALSKINRVKKATTI